MKNVLSFFRRLRVSTRLPMRRAAAPYPGHGVQESPARIVTWGGNPACPDGSMRIWAAAIGGERALPLGGARQNKAIAGNASEISGRGATVR
jgi:hypothetical protein